MGMGEGEGRRGKWGWEREERRGRWGWEREERRGRMNCEESTLFMLKQKFDLSTLCD